MKFIYVQTEGRDRYINVDHISSFAARVDSLQRTIGSVINVKDASYWCEDTPEELLNKIDQAPDRGQ